MKKENAVIITEVRIYLSGNEYYADASFYKVLERYYNNFEKIILITRIIEENEVKKGFKKIDMNIEYYNIGSIPTFMIKNIDKKINEIINSANIIILRLPSILSLKFMRIIKKYNKKYFTEIMGCAWDAYWNHGIIGKIIAPFFYMYMKKIVYNADFALYVTQKFLQRRYPCKNLNVGISNVNITNIYEPKSYKEFAPTNFTMLTAAGLNVRYKGQQHVIKAISKIKKEYNINIKYYLAGKGDATYLESIAKKYGVEDNIEILGMLNHDSLIEIMRKTDFYIQPSKQEGLPRAVVEAMSCGCVCFGSKVAGIPELLENKQLFEKVNSKEIVKCIMSNIKDKDELSKISKANTEKASEYKSDLLNEKRNNFYNEIKKAIGE